MPKKQAPEELVFHAEDAEGDARVSITISPVLGGLLKAVMAHRSATIAATTMMYLDLDEARLLRDMLTKCLGESRPAPPSPV